MSTALWIAAQAAWLSQSSSGACQGPQAVCRRPALGRREHSHKITHRVELEDRDQIRRGPCEGLHRALDRGLAGLLVADFDIASIRRRGPLVCQRKQRAKGGCR